MYNVNVAQAKAHLGGLRNPMEAGKEIVITRRSQPVVRLKGADMPCAEAIQPDNFHRARHGHFLVHTLSA